MNCCHVCREGRWGGCVQRAIPGSRGSDLSPGKKTQLPRREYDPDVDCFNPATADGERLRESSLGSLLKLGGEGGVFRALQSFVQFRHQLGAVAREQGESVKPQTR